MIEALAFGLAKKERQRAAPVVRVVRTQSSSPHHPSSVGRTPRRARSGSPPAQIALFPSFSAARALRLRGEWLTFSARHASRKSSQQEKTLHDDGGEAMLFIFHANRSLPRLLSFCPSSSRAHRTATSDASTCCSSRFLPRCDFLDRCSSRFSSTIQLARLLRPLVNQRSASIKA